MFSSISWTTYLLLLLALLIVWYLFIGLRYYPGELRRILKSRNRTSLTIDSDGEAKKIAASSTKAIGSPEVTQEDVVLPESPDDTFKQVESLVEKLKNAIAEASTKKQVHPELMYYLRLLIKEFPDLKYSPYRSAINELIISECEKLGTALNEEEAENLWKG